MKRPDCRKALDLRILLRAAEGVEGEPNPAMSWEAGRSFWLLSIYWEPGRVSCNAKKTVQSTGAHSWNQAIVSPTVITVEWGMRQEHCATYYRAVSKGIRIKAGAGLVCPYVSSEV